ncbi:MAG: glycosyltransferase [Saprospiraceae bacterium]|nr:glycosyltransferase [Saprospiraceae bacterium]
MLDILLHIAFWGCLAAVFHTYLAYPLLVKWLARGKSNNSLVFAPHDENLPQVSILMSLYNEERVIQDKLISLERLDYPREKLRLYIGSDASSDATNGIVAEAAKRLPWLHFSPFTNRRGKPGVINELAELAYKANPAASHHIFVITDANVMLTPDVLRQLVKHFKNPEIALVDAHMVHTGMQQQGISRSEELYISSEVLLKHREGICWGAMMGPFGGCYAVRSNYFSPVPPAYLVDDFYIAMRAFEQGGKAVNELHARCYEAVSHEISQEYRRKARIAAGNFQNMTTFARMWWPPLGALRFAFFSHKVLRWLTPFLLLAAMAAALVLFVRGNIYYGYLLVMMLFALIGIPAIDFILQRLQINILPLRSARYFVIMNLALLTGFMRFINGIKNNVWEPVHRYHPGGGR